MKKTALPLLGGLLLLFGACSPTTQSISVASPSDQIHIDFKLLPHGVPCYTVHYQDQTVLAESVLGFNLAGQAPLDAGFKLLAQELKNVDEPWEMPWGEQRRVENRYQELKVDLQESNAPHRRMNLYFRAYDDGIAFRYELPEQAGLDSLTILEELTQFQLTGDHTCWWIPGDWDSYEHLYNTTKFTGIDALSKRNHPNLAQTYIPDNAVNTPITMRTESGLHLSFHEANLTDYAEMTLKIHPERLLMESALVGSGRLGYKVKRALPFQTPWRMVQISDNAAGLIASKLVVNLNEPNKIGDVSWFKPMKYIGIWWEMHLNKSSWDLASGKHGATTEHTKAYIDFAAANNIGGVLVEGWNTGWEHWIGFEDREGVFDFVTPYPDYDLEEVVRYARSKGVSMIMHHETSAAPRTYDQQLDTAYALLQRLGIHAVKTGYVGPIIPKGEHHHGQYMVQHYRRVLEKAAASQVAVNAHEPIKATGIRRTYPNAISREGLRGQEFNSWSIERGNPPEHLPTVAFTRMLAGPIDFTPGMFKLKLAPYKDSSQVNTTLAQQLALYVVIYSPIQMACDLIEHYEGQPAFQFIRDVGVDWEQSLVLNGEVGDFVTIARQEKGTGNWFVGSITDENARTITIDFSFLDSGQSYDVTVYRDGEGAHWDLHPTSIAIEKMEIDATTQKTFELAPGGGLAISLLKK